MAIEVNLIKNDLAEFLPRPGGSVSAVKGFLATPSDSNYFTNPYDETKPIVSQAISLDVATEDITVEFYDGLVATIPAGVLEAGVKHPMNIVRLLDTGTGATVKVFVWI